MKYTTILIAFAIASAAFGISEQGIEKSLVPFSIDAKRALPEKMRNVAVYGVMKDANNRYSDKMVKRLVIAALRKAKLTIVDRDEAGTPDGGVLKELELSASGAIDVASVKQMGRMAGVDAFFFVYPQLSGIFGERIAIMIKAVDVASGAVVFVERYTYEDKLIAGVSITFAAEYYKGYSIGANVNISNAICTSSNYALRRPAFSAGMAGIIVDFTIPNIDIGFIIGAKFSGDATIGLETTAFTNMYINETLTTNSMMLQGFRGIPIFPYVGVSLPITGLFGDVKDILRLRIGSEFAFMGGSGDGQNRIRNVPNVFDQNHMVMDTMMIIPLIQAALDLKIAPGIRAMAGVNYMPSFTLTAPEFYGVTVTQYWRGGISAWAGFEYRLF